MSHDDHDYLLVIRGYGRILMTLGFVALGVGVAIVCGANYASAATPGWAVLVAGAAGLISGCILLAGARHS